MSTESEQKASHLLCPECGAAWEEEDFCVECGQDRSASVGRHHLRSSRDGGDGDGESGGVGEARALDAPTVVGVERKKNAAGKVFDCYLVELRHWTAKPKKRKEGQKSKKKTGKEGSGTGEAGAEGADSGGHTSHSGYGAWQVKRRYSHFHLFHAELVRWAKENRLGRRSKQVCGRERERDGETEKRRNRVG